MIRNRKDRKTGTIATHDKEIVKQSNDDEETFKDQLNNLEQLYHQNYINVNKILIMD